MVIEEVATPLVETHGPEVGFEIVAGAELTRQIFASAGAHMLAVSRAFDVAADQGRAEVRAPDLCALGSPVTPSHAATLAQDILVQVGGIGVVEAGRFAEFPSGAFGRLLAGPRS